MNKVPIVGLAALILVGLIAVGVFALSLRGMGKGNMFGTSDAAKEALKAGDYKAYMSALEEQWNSFKAQLTEEKFKEMVAQYNQSAQKMAAIEAVRSQVKQAIDNKDYNAWKEAIGNSTSAAKLTEMITAENFDKYVEMQKALQNKDIETAKQLAQEIGLKEPAIGKFGHYRGNFRINPSLK